jgi:hypothetical protein
MQWTKLRKHSTMSQVVVKICSSFQVRLRHVVSDFTSTLRGDINDTGDEFILNDRSKIEGQWARDVHHWRVNLWIVAAADWVDVQEK